MAIEHVDELLKMMVERKASDLHLGFERPPYLRIDGKLTPTELPILTEEDLERYARQLLTPKREHILEEKDEYDFAYSAKGIEGRFRVNMYHQRGTISLAIRHLKTYIPSFEELNLPPILEKISMLPRGIVIVTGTTGSGKSTTLAAMIQYINTHKSVHIITIEDPIEYNFTDNKSIIDQREIGIDTEDFYVALRAAMREDPDVIMVGEMRDKETILAAITAAITGHLVLTTLHTTNVVQTINRIIEYYPSDMQQQVRIMLSQTIQAVISMRLLPRIGGGRIPALEIMIATARIREFIQDPEKTELIKTAMEEGEYDGMQTFDQHLLRLYKSKVIDYETALNAASSPHDFQLMLRQSSIIKTPTKRYYGDWQKANE